MSSKKLVYLLMMVAIVCGFIASDVAHGQSTGVYAISGIVMDSDGTPVGGLNIKGERIDRRDILSDDNAVALIFEDIVQADGSYKLTFSEFPFSSPPAPKISAGERIEITVTDPNDNNAVVGRVVHTVGTDLVAAITSVTVNIPLSGVSAEAAPAELPADGVSTSTITVTITGANNTGDTVTIDSPAEGTVSAVTEVGGGVYTATYTAPLDLTLSFPRTVAINANSATGPANTLITLLPVPTTVTVELGKNSFIADTPEETTVTVTVAAENVGPVTDENVTLSLSADGGSVTSPATNNANGTYSATYTSGGTAGNVTLTATAVGSGTSGSASITINAGPPAAIALSAAHSTVTSLASTTLTAMVTDSNGNPAGAALTAATMSGGAVGEFSSTVFGTYTATYTAPMVDVGVQMPETVTVSTDGISDSETFNLLGEDPIPVDAIEIRGTVYKEDGEIIADGLNVTVTVQSSSETDTAGSDGSYGVAFLGFGQTVATTGDTVSVAVDGANVVCSHCQRRGTERITVPIAQCHPRKSRSRRGGRS